MQPYDHTTMANEPFYRERLAKWMGQRGFATGHGDTFDDLLGELSWQVHELQVKAQAAEAKGSQ